MAGDGTRIAALDHIRGLSVLGILIVNAIAFAQPLSVYIDPALSTVLLSPADIGTWWLIETFCRDKFVTLFSLLFGVSAFLVGGAPGDEDGERRLKRRLMWLLLFGVLHGALIWHGDILVLYAVAGLMFMRWRRETARRLLTLGGVFFLVGAAVIASQGFLAGPGDGPPSRADDLRTIVTMRGDFLHSLAGNALTWGTGVFGNTVGYLPTTLGLMMLGLGLFKTGLLKGEARPRLYLGLIAAAAASLALIGWQNEVIVAEGFPYLRMLGLYGIANTLLCLPVALGYAAILILLARSRLGTWVLHPLACAGRMAFTNYLTQSIVMTMIFYGGRGPGLYGQMNHAALWPFVVTIWIAQLVVSTLWMKWFRYGPFEWLWRSLTLGRPVAWRNP